MAQQKNSKNQNRWYTHYEICYCLKIVYKQVILLVFGKNQMYRAYYSRMSRMITWKARKLIWQFCTEAFQKRATSVTIFLLFYINFYVSIKLYQNKYCT